MMDVALFYLQVNVSSGLLKSTKSKEEGYRFSFVAAPEAEDTLSFRCFQ